MHLHWASSQLALVIYCSSLINNKLVVVDYTPDPIGIEDRLGSLGIVLIAKSLLLLRVDVQPQVSVVPSDLLRLFQLQ